MNTIKSAVLIENQQIIIQNVASVELLPDECEVEITDAGICSSDIARGYGGGAYFYPLVMGHEASGVVVNVGSNVGNEFKVGDNVCIFPLLPCFQCSACESKLYSLCYNYSYYGSRRNGAFAERLNVNKWNLQKLPDNVDLEDAALVEPTAVTVHAVEKLDIDINKPTTVCVFGAGFLGLIAVQLIKLLFPKCDVFLVDRNMFKLEIGAKHGANTIWVGEPSLWKNFLSENHNKFDRVIEFVGSPDTFSAAIQVAGAGSKVVWAGNISDNLTMSKSQISTILRKELAILGTWNSIYKGNGVCNWTQSIDLISRGLKPSKLISLKIGLDDVNETLAKLYAHKMHQSKFDVVKVLLKPNG